MEDIQLNNTVLLEKMEKFDFSNPPIDPIALAKTLAETMIKTKGVGLSSNQIGLPFNAFAITGNPVMVMFNARIIEISDEQVYLEEGCLSFPNLFMKIKRPTWVKIRFTMPNGETITKHFEGMTARIIQHEMDHMNGITFHKRANSIHRERGINQMKKRNNR